MFFFYISAVGISIQHWTKPFGLVAGRLFSTVKGILSANSLDTVSVFTFQGQFHSQVLACLIQFPKSTLVPLRNQRIVKPLRFTCENARAGGKRVSLSTFSGPC